MKPTYTREPLWLCHHCGYAMDTADLVYQNDHRETAPKEGDYSVCMNCGQCHTRHGRHWQRTTAAELGDMHPNNRRQIAEAQLGISVLHARGMPDLSKRGGRA